jgi:hypothetical protein
VLVNVALERKLGQQAEVLSADFMKELAAFVRGGKSLLIFAGDNVAPEPYNRLLGDKHGLLPSKILGRMEFPYESPVMLNRSTFVHPAYRHLRDDDRFKLFSVVEMYRALDMAEPAAKPLDAKAPLPATDDEAHVIVRYARQLDDAGKKEPKPATETLHGEGKPAVLLRRVGAGQVLLVTTAAERDLKDVVLAEKGKKVRYRMPTWTNWLIEEVERTFVIFLRVSLAQLLHEESQVHNLTAGQALTWYPREKDVRAYVLVHPDDEEERLGLPEEEVLPGGLKGKPVVTSGRLSKAGVYQLSALAPSSTTKENVGKPVMTWPLAVVPDLRESENLDALSDSQIDERLGFQPVHLTAGRATTLERVNREWTPWLLLAVLLLAVGESVLAWWCGRTW